MSDSSETTEPTGQVALDVDLTGADLTLNERIAVEDVCGRFSREALT